MQALTHHCWSTCSCGMAARTRRRVTAAMMTICYVFVMFGVPVLQPLPPVASAGPYPCQGGTCGCRSASQCWRSCCCFTDAQKLAWAEEHHVTPPPEFLRRMEAQGKFLAVHAERRKDGTSRRACCQTTAAPRSAPDKARPEGAGAGSCCQTAPADREGKKNEASFVITVEALKCRGLGSDWTGLAAFVPTTRPSNWQCERTAATVAPLTEPRLPELSFPPPAPPPRV